MIWLKIKDLERKLAAGEVSDREAFYYLVVPICFDMLFHVFSFFHPPKYIDAAWYHNRSFEEIFYYVLMLSVLWTTFHINNQGGGKDYFKRIIAVSTVIATRFLTFILGPIVAIFGILELFVLRLRLLHPDRPRHAALAHGDSFYSASFLLVAGVLIIYGFLIIRSFRRINFPKVIFSE